MLCHVNLFLLKASAMQAGGDLPRLKLMFFPLPPVLLKPALDTSASLVPIYIFCIAPTCFPLLLTSFPLTINPLVPPSLRLPLHHPTIRALKHVHLTLCLSLQLDVYISLFPRVVVCRPNTIIEEDWRNPQV